jgi:hypothetical protein
MPLSQCELPHTPLEQFLNYSTDRARISRPVKNVGMLPDDQTLASIGVLDSRYASGAEHVEAALAGLGP